MEKTPHEASAAGAPRRAVLAVGAAGAVGALTGCAVYGGQPDPPPPPPADPANPADAGTPVASTGDVPVGGGLIETDHGVVITQPAGGDFRAFSSTCTHQGCTVAEVSDGTINCACHGSRFSIEDGSVVQAAQGLSPDQQRPLPPVGITVAEDTITVP